MPDNDAGEKTEDPTPRKMENARKEGQVALSTEVTTAGLLLTGVSVLVLLGPQLWQALQSPLRLALGPALGWELDRPGALLQLLGGYQQLAALCVGFLLAMFVVAAALGLAQVGIFFTAKPLQPKWSRISPLAGLKRLFGLRGLMRFVFSLAKLIVVVTISWLAIRSEVTGHLLFSFDLRSQYAETVWVLVLLAFKLAGVLALIAAFDYLYQRYQHRRDLLMSKQEVKDENKQAEGDPLLKSRIRQLQRQMAQNRMMSEVPKADVVITNPTHVAVALRYRQEKMQAPILVAKGYDLIAGRIKAIAAEHGIVQVENVALARALAKQVKLGQAIPVEFYQQVAEILSRVYQLQKR